MINSYVRIILTFSTNIDDELVLLSKMFVTFTAVIILNSFLKTSKYIILSLSKSARKIFSSVKFWKPIFSGPFYKMCPNSNALIELRSNSRGPSATAFEGHNDRWEWILSYTSSNTIHFKVHRPIIKCSRCIITMKMHSYFGLEISLQDMHYAPFPLFPQILCWLIWGFKGIFRDTMKEGLCCGVKCEIWVKSPTNKGQRLHMFLFNARRNFGRYMV